MMSRRSEGQRHLFYGFHLDEVVPDDHLVRKVDAVLELSWVSAELVPHYSQIGRPSIDLWLRLLVGQCLRMALYVMLRGPTDGAATAGGC